MKAYHTEELTRKGERVYPIEHRKSSQP